MVRRCNQVNDDWGFGHNTQQDAKYLIQVLLRELDEEALGNEDEIKEAKGGKHVMEEEKMEEGKGMEERISDMFLYHYRENKENETFIDAVLSLGNKLGEQVPEYLFHYCRISEVIQNTLNCRKVQTQTGTIDVQTKIVKLSKYLIVHFPKNIERKRGKVTIKDQLVFLNCKRVISGRLLSVIQHHGSSRDYGHYTA